MTAWQVTTTVPGRVAQARSRGLVARSGLDDPDAVMRPIPREVYSVSESNVDSMGKKRGRPTAAGGRGVAKKTGESGSAANPEDSEVVDDTVRTLDTDQYVDELTVEGDAEEALRLAHDALREVGRLVVGGDRDGPRDARVSGVVGAGPRDENPVVVHVDVVCAEAGRCTLRIAGSAAEGLIKQGLARMAVEKVLLELKSR